MAVLSLYDTVTLATPGTPSRLFLTMNGQSAQCMFFTAKVIVFSAANVAGETTTPTAKAAQARSFVIGSLRSRVEEQGRNEVEAKCGNDKDRCDNEPSLDKPVW